MLQELAVLSSASLALKTNTEDPLAELWVRIRRRSEERNQSSQIKVL